MTRTWPTGVVIAVLASAGLAVAVMQTALVPVLPELPGLLGQSANDVSWLLTATLLASAVATPSFSRLADMHGKRRMLIVSLACLIAGSALGALSTSLTVLVVARALQGCSMALVPIGMSIMRDELPRERLGAAVALMSATLGIGAAIGLPLTGVIFEHLGWHALFWMPTAVGTVILVAVLAVIRESPVRAGGRFDYLGAVLMSGGLLTLLLAITKGGQWGWTSPSTVGAFTLSLLLFAVWVPWELRTGHPLIDLTTSAHRPVLVTNIAAFLFGFAMFCNMLSSTQLLEMPTTTGYGFGMSVLQSGLLLLPAALMMVVLAPVSAAITKTFGAKMTMLTGSVLFIVGYLLRIALMDSVWEIVLGAVIVSAGTAVTYSAMPVLIMRSVPLTETAAANGLNTVVRSIGTSTASAAVAAVLTTFTIAIGSTALPSQGAFRIVFLLATGMAAAGGLVTLGLPRHRPSEHVPVDQLRAPDQDHEVVVHGIVRSAGEEAHEHALVTVTRLSGEVIDWCHADDDGAFSLVMPDAGNYVVTAALGEISTAIEVSAHSATAAVEIDVEARS